MVQFASRMDLLKGSEIRELLKLTSQPDIISFAGGMPAPELFPVEQMMQASEAVLKENGRVALQYSSTEGYPRLREQIAERMLAKNNIHTDADHILVTSGSQQGLDFSARVFLNPGDVVLLESPSYLGAVNAFKACEPTFIEVPTDDGGMIMEELEKILKNAEVVVEDEVDLDKINIGCQVKIRDLEYNEDLDYKIVGSTEANSLKGKISNESPVGKALIGAKVGDIVEVETQAGVLKYEVLEIQRSN